jgi:ribonuclease VapC
MSAADSSALVAILAPESDGVKIAARLQDRKDAFTSPLVIFETVLALRRLRQAPIAEMIFIVREFLARAGVEVRPIDADLYLTALQAHELYGKGSGHPARLNMGDCFSYAMAKRAGVPLLYKGNDFAQTDLA